MKPDDLDERLARLEKLALTNNVLLQMILTEQFAARQMIGEMLASEKPCSLERARGLWSIALLEAEELVQSKIEQLGAITSERRADSRPSKKKTK